MILGQDESHKFPASFPTPLGPRNPMKNDSLVKHVIRICLESKMTLRFERDSVPRTILDILLGQSSSLKSL